MVVLCLVAAGLIGVAAAGGQPPAEAPAAAPAPVRPPSPMDQPTDPAVEEIIGDLERAAAPRRAVQPAVGSGGVEAQVGRGGGGGQPVAVRAGRPRAASGALVPEGTFLPSRRGRMSLSEAGEWLFTFDGGPDGLSEPAMVLLPGRNLEAMENIAEARGDAAVFVLSGQVFVYRGRNYLMPTFFRLDRRTDEVIPLQ